MNCLMSETDFSALVNCFRNAFRVSCGKWSEKLKMNGNFMFQLPLLLFFAFRVFSDSKHNFSGLRRDPTQFCANTLLRIMCPAGMEGKNNRICVEYICKYPRLHISFETDVLEIHFRISHFTCVNWLSSFRTFISMCFITCTSLFEFKKKINKNYISVYFHMFNK